jgi:hypothetical protein
MADEFRPPSKRDMAVVNGFTGAALATAAWPIRQALVGMGSGTRSRRHDLADCSRSWLSFCRCWWLHRTSPAKWFTEHDVCGRILRRRPKQPAWIKSLPLLGRRLAAAWNRVVEVKGDLRTLLEPYTADIQQMMIGAAHALADSIVQVLLSPRFSRPWTIRTVLRTP